LTTKGIATRDRPTSMVGLRQPFPVNLNYWVLWSW